MSRAGCEPGYKKTNQDNCFAFEKYITEDQALFGAMDGHGPNGEAPALLWGCQGYRVPGTRTLLSACRGSRAVPTCRSQPRDVSGNGVVRRNTSSRAVHAMVQVYSRACLVCLSPGAQHSPSLFSCAGHFVSGFVKKQLPMLLVSHMDVEGHGNGGSDSSGVREALRGAFLEVETNLEASSIDCEFSGCTCAVAHLQVRGWLVSRFRGTRC